MLADIAMVKLNESIALRRRLISTVDLARSKRLPDDVVVSGWGATSFMKETESYLLRASMKMVPFGECKEFYSDKLLPGMMCAGSGGSDSCSGDSGGPMVAKVNGKAILRGVVSWGNRCGTGGFPGVYSDVVYFRSWIDDSLCQFDVPG